MSFSIQSLRSLSNPIVVIVICLALIVGCDSATSGSAKTEAVAEKVGTVELSIEFGDGASKRIVVDCFTDSTVFSVLQSAEKSGEIKLDAALYQQKAFIKAIDDIENEGANGQNWIYEVNGVMAKVGCSDFSLKPGDKILWAMKSDVYK